MPPTKTLRSDARRNHERLVAAGREAFAEDGVAASLEGIAARAGVGIGTLYRHFPAREALVEAVFDDQLDEWLAAADHAAANEDAWEGLREYLERTVELQAAHRALRDVVAQLPGGERMAGAREQMRARLATLLERARDEGALRADFELADLTLLFWSLGPVSEATAAAPHAARRHLGFVLDGLRPAAATPQDDPPLTEEQLADAHRALRAARFPRPRSRT